MSIHPKHAAQRGSALLLAMIMVIVLIGYAGSLLSVALANSRGSMEALDDAKATYVAEAGINAAMAEINSGVDPDADGLGTIARNYPNAQNATCRYKVRCTNQADGSFRLVVAGASSAGTRALEVVARPQPPFPGDDAALGLFGFPGKHEKFKIFSDKKEDDDDDDKDVHDSVVINGYPADGGKPVPAMAIQDPIAYNKIMEKLSKEIAKGKVSADSFKGEPIVDYTNSKGYTTHLPITLTPEPHFNPDLLADLRDKIIDKTESVIIPSATRVIDKDSEKIKVPTTWGTPATPQTTVVTAKDLRLEKGAVLTGAGTLVVQGELKVEKDAVLNWTGTIIVIGNEDKGKDSAKLTALGGQVNVVGNILVMGTNKGAADLRVDDEGKKRQGGLKVTGAVLVMGGPDDKKRARVRGDAGDFLIDGFLGVFGEKAELKVEEDHHDTGAFTVNGSTVVAVPDNDDEKHEKLAIKLHGNTSLRFDRTKLNAAMGSILNFTGQNGIPLPLGVRSWREMSPYDAAGGVPNWNQSSTNGK
ncbi:MAG: hypothetical protein HYZ53_24855 [Planctomycetes bacterium]|nr:hypothetical protein [Planctomycetota bacterium]